MMLQNDHPRKKIHSLFFKQIAYTNSLRKSRYLSLLLGFITYLFITTCTSQEGYERNSGSTSSRKLRVTMLSSEWRSTKGGLSTINRELAIQLAKHPNVEVSVYLPQCSEGDKRVAASHHVHLIEAEEMAGLEPDLWLSCLPEDHAVDCVIGHGAVLGRQVQIIKHHHHCKWIQVVHTAPEELGMYKSYTDAISRGEKKHQAEVKLCEKADQVVAVGPKLAEAFSGYLRSCGKDQDVLNLTPGVFSEFADVKQATEERKMFSVLAFGRGDNEDFQLKGYDIAAKAIAELKDDPQPYKLLFVGARGGEEETVKDLLLQQGIDHSQLSVRCFNESREQLAGLFCEADLAIMPSRTEGFGLAALEALSAGLPVLVSGNSGLGETLKKVSFGSNCVVESENPKDWACAIRVVRKKDREMRLDECKTLREKYAIKYNWQDHCNRLVDIMLNISRGKNYTLPTVCFVKVQLLAVVTIGRDKCLCWLQGEVAVIKSDKITCNTRTVTIHVTGMYCSATSVTGVGLDELC